LAIGDFNGAGWLDAATANFSGNNVSVLINDTQWPPVDTPSVTINDVSVTEGNTGTVNATFTVNLSAAYGQPVTISYATANGSATVGSDYIGGSGDVTFAPARPPDHHVAIGDHAANPRKPRRQPQYDQSFIGDSRVWAPSGRRSVDFH
jgi:hypothetical protein